MKSEKIDHLAREQALRKSKITQNESKLPEVDEKQKNAHSKHK